MQVSKKLIAVFVLAAAVAAGSAAFAAIPGANGVIAGCYDRQSGQLRVTDAQTNAPKGCTTKESPLAWNQQGPPGPKGVSHAEYETTSKTITATTNSYPGAVVVEKALGPGTYMVTADLEVNGYGEIVPLEVVRCALNTFYTVPNSGSGGAADYGKATVWADATGDLLAGSIALSERLTVPAGGTGKAWITCWAPHPARADNVDLWALQLDSIG